MTKAHQCAFCGEYPDFCVCFDGPDLELEDEWRIWDETDEYPEMDYNPHYRGYSDIYPHIVRS